MSPRRPEPELRPGSIPVRVKPGAARTAVGGSYAGPYGPAVIVAVHAPAVDGRATQAVVVALAEALGVRPRQLTLRAGATSRDKVFTVTDPPDDLASRVGVLQGTR
jgi:uncharacterized protein YggU (UPF0235/DUF167 family)